MQRFKLDHAKEKIDNMNFYISRSLDSNLEDLETKIRAFKEETMNDSTSIVVYDQCKTPINSANIRKIVDKYNCLLILVVGVRLYHDLPIALSDLDGSIECISDCVIGFKRTQFDRDDNRVIIQVYKNINYPLNSFEFEMNRHSLKYKELYKINYDGDDLPF